MYRTIAYKVLQNHCNHEIITNSFYHWLYYLENSALKFIIFIKFDDDKCIKVYIFKKEMAQGSQLHNRFL